MGENQTGRNLIWPGIYYAENIRYIHIMIDVSCEILDDGREYGCIVRLLTAWHSLTTIVVVSSLNRFCDPHYSILDLPRRWARREFSNYRGIINNYIKGMRTLLTGVNRSCTEKSFSLA